MPCLFVLFIQTPHASLDLFFVESNAGAFTVTGNGAVHITGYTTLLELGQPSDDEEEEGESEVSDEAPTAQVQGIHIYSIHLYNIQPYKYPYLFIQKQP